MTKIILKKNKTCPAKLQQSRGFVLLFAVTLTSILLAIALGIANIALKEVKFGTNARDTNDAFFAADTGAECALVNDKSTSNVFVSPPPRITCNNNNIIVTKDTGVSIWRFIVPALNNGGQGCAIVTVDKTTSTTKIISKGHNNGSSSCDSSSNPVERQLEVSY